MLRTAATYLTPFADDDLCFLCSSQTLSRYEIDRSDIVAANKTLNVVEWLLFSPTLDSAVSQANIVQLNDASYYVSNRTTHQLDYITCGGKTCLITLPNVWNMGDSVQSFGIAGATIGLLLTTATAVSLVVFRQRTVYRSASIVFLAMINLGLFMMFLSAIPLVGLAPSVASCSGFAWLFNFGWAFTFKPL